MFNSYEHAKDIEKYDEDGMEIGVESYVYDKDNFLNYYNEQDYGTITEEEREKLMKGIDWNEVERSFDWKGYMDF